MPLAVALLFRRLSFGSGASTSRRPVCRTDLYRAGAGHNIAIMQVDPAVAGAICQQMRGMAPLDISHAATEHGAGRRGARANACTPRLYAPLSMLLIMARSVGRLSRRALDRGDLRRRAGPDRLDRRAPLRRRALIRRHALQATSPRRIPPGLRRLNIGSLLRSRLIQI